jgi:RimJ/RimL family protein N-acetyltransferase
VSNGFRRKLPDKSYLELGRRDLVLRTLSASDAELVFNWRTKYKEYFFSAGPDSIDAQRKWYKKYAEMASDIVFIIEKRDEPVGMVSLYDIDLEDSRASFGRLLIDEEHQRAGHAKRACKYVLDFARSIGVSRISLEVKTDNEAAKYLYTQLGFKEDTSDAKVTTYMIRL